jgi:hypothetical protein
MANIMLSHIVARLLIAGVLAMAGRISEDSSDLST